MKKLISILVLAAGFFIAGTTFAQPAPSLRGRRVRQIPPCSGTNKGVTLSIIDATTQDTIGTGGGSAVTVAICNGTDYVPISSTVSNIDGNPSIILDTDDSGSDVTITPADDFVLTAGDAVTLTSAGVFLIDNTGGATTTIDTDAAGSDIVLTPADDLLLSPVDALTAAVGGAASITTTAGAITLTAGGTTQDITLASVDDILHTGDNFSVTTTSVTLNPGASTVELAMVAGTSTFLGSLILPIGSAPPAVCAAGTKGTIYYDSDANVLCVCDATSYKLVADQSSTTGCS